VIYYFMPITNPAPLEKTLMRDDIYQHLKNWIVQGTLEPEEKLRDIDLAIQLGVSRTPVREALRRLEDEGLVETKQNAWTRVSKVDVGLANRIYPILKLLEPLALELAAPQFLSVDFKRMRLLNAAIKRALEAGNGKTAALHDTDFHDTFIVRCGNPELIQIIQNLKTNHIRLEIAYWRGGKNALESVNEHERLIAALERSDLKAAKLALGQNFVRALARISSDA
jgi:DNA-binding GntR family transcriptional regulator